VITSIQSPFDKKENDFAYLEISVQTSSGKSIGCTSIKTERSDTIKQVKQKIWERDSITTGWEKSIIKTIWEESSVAFLKKELFYAEALVEENRTIADYGIQYNSTLPLTLRLNRGMYVYVKTLVGRTIIIETEPDDTIENFRAKIQDQVSFPSHTPLIYAGKQLEEGRTLSSYYVKEQSTFQLVLRIRGGGTTPLPFADLSLENERRIAFHPDAPRWRYVAPGLNLSGTCRNPKCAANGQMVWVKKGFITSTISKLASEALCPEPTCSQRVSNVMNCGFYQCIFSIEGEKASGESIERLNIRAPDDELLSFNEVTSDQSDYNYHYLKITTAAKAEPTINEIIARCFNSLSPIKTIN